MEQSAAQQYSGPILGKAKNAHMPQDQSNVDSTNNAQIANPRSLLVTKANGGIESAITQAQEKARIEPKKTMKCGEGLRKQWTLLWQQKPQAESTKIR